MAYLTDQLRKMLHDMMTSINQSHEILQFMYLGEATFYQDRINEFLNVARSLDIKEISKENLETKKF